MEAHVPYSCLLKDGEPSTFHKAINNQDASQWITAMQEETKAFHENKTWELKSHWQRMGL